MYVSELEAIDFSRDTYDCVIIGGGIIGLYLASCSAFEGLKIALIPGGPKQESQSNLNSSQSGISNEEISENSILYQLLLTHQMCLFSAY